MSDLEPDWPDAGQEELARMTSVEAHERRGTRGVRQHMRNIAEHAEETALFESMARRSGLRGEAANAYVDARLDGLNHSQAFVEALRFETKG